MLRLAECIQIGKDGVAFYLSRVFHTDVVRVGVHAHNLLFDVLRLIRQVNAVAKGLAHLCLAIGTRQTHANLILRQQDVRHGQGLAVYAVKLMHNFTGLFHHRHLVLACRYRGSTERGDIRSLADGISKEAHRDACLEIAHLNFRLNGWIALQAGYGNQIHIVNRQLRQLRHHGLDKQRGFCRVQSAGQVIQRNLQNVLAHFFRIIRIVRQSLRIRNHNKNFIVFTGILQLYPALQRAYIMAQMQLAGRTVSG